MKAQIIGGEFVWNIIWEKDCFAFICRVLKCLYLMDKAPLEQVGIGLDATYKPMERGGGHFEEEDLDLWQSKGTDEIDERLCNLAWVVAYFWDVLQSWWSQHGHTICLGEEWGWAHAILVERSSIAAGEVPCHCWTDMESHPQSRLQGTPIYELVQYSIWIHTVLFKLSWLIQWLIGWDSKKGRARHLLNTNHFRALLCTT